MIKSTTSSTKERHAEAAKKAQISTRKPEAMATNGGFGKIAISAAGEFEIERPPWAQRRKAVGAFLRLVSGL